MHREPMMMGRIHGDLLDRTFRFSLAILEIVDRLPSNNKGWIVTRQLVRSGTSVGANIAEADHAHTAAEFARCCNIALKEAAEADDWLRLCRESGLIARDQLSPMLSESDEIIRVLSVIVRKTQDGHAVGAGR
jgi:four helix bundle protein